MIDLCQHPTRDFGLVRATGSCCPLCPHCGPLSGWQTFLALMSVLIIVRRIVEGIVEHLLNTAQFQGFGLTICHMADFSGCRPIGLRHCVFVRC